MQPPTPIDRSPARPAWIAAAALAALIAGPAPTAHAERPVAAPALIDLLTPAERAWIEAHGPLLVGPSRTYRPLDFVDDERVWRGYAADVFELIAERLDVEFELVAYSAEDRAANIRAKQFEVAPLTAQTAARREQWDYTDPYLVTPVVVLARRDQVFDVDLETLAGLNVGVVGGWAAETFVRDERPLAVVHPVLDTATGLRLVAAGAIDVMLSDLPVATWELQRQGIANLTIVGDSGYQYELSVGVLRSLPIAKAIIEKGLATIPASEHRELLDRWVNFQRDPRWYEHAAVWYSIALITILLGAGILGSWIWNLSLRRQVSDRAAEIERRHAALIESERERQELREGMHRTQRMEALGRIAGGIAHDFNNVLACVSGFTELAREKIADEHTARGYLDEVLRASDRARDLVQQIVTFGRPASDAHLVFDAADVVHEASTLLRATLPAGIEVVERSSLEDLHVRGDASQLHQIVLNLGTNAAHAMAGSGQLRISCKPAAIDADRAERLGIATGDYICLTVRDNGTGMNQATIDRAFDPFFTTKDVGEGTGLGLAVVHGIVSAHAGAVEIDSTEGAGTEIRVLLPRSTDAIAVNAAANLDPEGHERVLVVDDQPQVLEVLALSLERRGYDVLRDTSATSALARFHAAPADFDLVLTDQDMPNLSGTDLAIAVHELRPHLPIILITGFGQLLDARTTERAGVAEVLAKPVSGPQLARVVRRTLDRSRAVADEAGRTSDRPR